MFSFKKKVFLNLIVLQCSLTWLFFTEGRFFLLQTFTLVLGTWDFRRVVLPVKIKVKKALNTPDFSMFFVTRYPTPFSSESTFSLVLLLLLMCLQKPFLLPITTPNSTKYRWGLASLMQYMKHHHSRRNFLLLFSETKWIYGFKNAKQFMSAVLCTVWETPHSSLITTLSLTVLTHYISFHQQVWFSIPHSWTQDPCENSCCWVCFEEFT